MQSPLKYCHGTFPSFQEHFFLPLLGKTFYLPPLWSNHYLVIWQAYRNSFFRTIFISSKEQQQQKRASILLFYLASMPLVSLTVGLSRVLFLCPERHKSSLENKSSFQTLRYLGFWVNNKHLYDKRGPHRIEPSQQRWLPIMARLHLRAGGIILWEPDWSRQWW